MKKLPGALNRLLDRQAGVASRKQLDSFGIDRYFIRRQIDRGLFREVSDNVIALHAQPVSRMGLLWAATLHSNHHLLTGAAALELIGLAPERSAVIDVIGPRGGFDPFFNMVRVHTSRLELRACDSLPLHTQPEATVLNAMAWAASERQAVFYALFAIQKRNTTLERLRSEVALNPRNRNYASAARLLLSISEGVTTLSEQLFLDLCRAQGLPEPRRQVLFREDSGRNRFADFAFEVNGLVLIVEIDGVGHLAADVRIDDIQRSNELARMNARVLRIPAHELYVSPEPYMRQIQSTLAAMRAA